MSMNKNEMRQFERYKLRYPATIRVDGKGPSLTAHIDNISAGGALCYTDKIVHAGVPLTIDIILTNGTVKKLTGTHPKISVEGCVVRSEKHGLAVSFNGNQKIMPLGAIITTN